MATMVNMSDGGPLASENGRRMPEERPGAPTWPPPCKDDGRVSFSWHSRASLCTRKWRAALPRISTDIPVNKKVKYKLDVFYDKKNNQCKSNAFVDSCARPTFS
jgi:hypothetical protein